MLCIGYSGLGDMCPNNFRQSRRGALNSLWRPRLTSSEKNNTSSLRLKTTPKSCYTPSPPLKRWVLQTLKNNLDGLVLDNVYLTVMYILCYLFVTQVSWFCKEAKGVFPIRMRVQVTCWLVNYDLPYSFLQQSLIDSRWWRMCCLENSLKRQPHPIILIKQLTELKISFGAFRFLT